MVGRARGDTLRRERHRCLSLPRWKDWSSLVLRRRLWPGSLLLRLQIHV